MVVRLLDGKIGCAVYERETVTMLTLFPGTKNFASLCMSLQTISD